MAPAPRLFSIPETAEHLGCTRFHVYDLIAAGRLAVVNIGIGRSRSRITEDELDRFIKANTYGTKRKRGVA